MTEGLIIAVQDQSLTTRLYHRNIIKDGTNPLCRTCGNFDESVDHVISGCPELAKTEYIQRHDNTASYIHWKVCQSYDIKTNDKSIIFLEFIFLPIENKPANLTKTRHHFNKFNCCKKEYCMLLLNEGSLG